MTDKEKERWILAGKILAAAGGAILGYFNLKK